MPIQRTLAPERRRRLSLLARAAPFPRGIDGRALEVPSGPTLLDLRCPKAQVPEFPPLDDRDLVVHVLSGAFHPRVNGRNGTHLGPGGAFRVGQDANVTADADPDESRLLAILSSRAPNMVAPAGAQPPSRGFAIPRLPTRDHEGARERLLAGAGSPDDLPSVLSSSVIDLAPASVWIRPVPAGTAAVLWILDGCVSTGDGFDLRAGQALVARDADAVGLRANGPSQVAFVRFRSVG